MASGSERPAASSYCGASGKHRPHEWLDGAVRRDCPGEPPAATTPTYPVPLTKTEAQSAVMSAYLTDV